MFTKQLLSVALFACLAAALVPPPKAIVERTYSIEGFPQPPLVPPSDQLSIESQGKITTATGNMIFEDKYTLDLTLHQKEGRNHTEPFVTMDFSYEQIKNNTKQVIKFKIFLLRITEYLPSPLPANQGYNKHNISAYSTNFPGRSWKPGFWTRLPTPGNKPGEHHFEAVSADGIFRIYGRFSESKTWQWGNSLVKLNFQINGYPYVRKDTKLAAIMRVESQYDLEVRGTDIIKKPKTQGIFLGDGSGLALGTFQWATTVENATGHSFPVQSNITHLISPEPVDSKYHVVASFLAPQGPLDWDPSIGVEYQLAPNKEAVVQPNLVVSVLAGVGGTVVFALFVGILVLAAIYRVSQRRDYIEIK